MPDCCPPTGDSNRLTDRPLPSYAHTPGVTPHPVSDPEGHSHGEEASAAEPLDPTRWRENSDYCYGIDLFNGGFYWEAHEAWERVWIACGRRGESADFLKGLIKLAAAALKHREGRPKGVRRHASRALELLPDAAAVFAGVDLADLRRAGSMADGNQSFAPRLRIAPAE